MTSVSYSFSANTTATASEVNANFNDVIALASAIGNDQLVGGITADKLAAKNAVSWVALPILPISYLQDLAAPDTYIIPTAMTTLAKFQPVMKAGVEGYLCAIIVHVIARATGGSGGNPQIDFRLNGSTVIGGAAIQLATDDNSYLIAANDPIANPLMSLTDGDYIEIRMGSSAADSPEARGVNVYLAMKYEAQA